MLDQTSQSSIPGLGVIIMAAGLGKRMKSKLAKVLHPVAGKPMVLYVVDVACRLGEQGVALIVGHQGADVRKAVEVGGRQVAVAEQTKPARDRPCGVASCVGIAGDVQRRPSRAIR
ncbi:MAG: NTP transferase domain-containing protein [Nitrospiraceae bacterium]